MEDGMEAVAGGEERDDPFFGGDGYGENGVHVGCAVGGGRRGSFRDDGEGIDA